MPDFGEPSPSFVPEVAWLVHDEHGFWPTWDQAIEAVSRLLPCDPDEAERRLLDAIRDSEVRSRFDDDGDWTITITEGAADRIARMYLDNTMERKENHGQQA